LEYPDLFWLLVSTALLLIVFIARTPLEQRLAAGFGSLFPLLLVLLLVAAVADLMYITLLPEVQFLPAAPETWAHVIGITVIASMLAAIIVIARPPSRLERAIAIRLGDSNTRYRAYRAAGCVALLGGSVSAIYWFRQYYLYQHYCVGYIERQDYFDCQFLH
jgi:hypothetical protein